MIKVHVAITNVVTEEQVANLAKLLETRLKAEFNINVGVEVRMLGQTTNVLTADIRVEFINAELETVVPDMASDHFRTRIKDFHDQMLESLRFLFTPQQRVELTFVFIEALWGRVGGITPG